MKQSADFLRLLIRAIGCAVLSIGTTEAGPSFACSKAGTWSEKAVCKDSQLSDLDRQVAALYREAMAHITPLAQGVLKDEQKEWLGKREKCKQKANAADCLLRVYRRRVEELATWAGRPPTDTQMAQESAPAAEPLPEITAAVVWDGDSVPWRQDCDFGDFACVLDMMRSTGASDEAVAFSRRVEGWAYEFDELGKVDVVSWVGAFAANVIQGQCLVNGSPDCIDISSYQFTEQDRRRPDVREVLARLSDGFLANSHFVRKKAIPDGTRFIVEADYVRCNACRNEALARAQIGYDVSDQGLFQGSRLLTVSLADANDRTEASPVVGAEAATKADGASVPSHSLAAEGVAERCGEEAPFFDLKRGQEQCGYGLTAEGGFAYNGRVATDRLVVSSLPADRNVATDVRIFSNKSTDGRYQVVWAIRQGPNSEQWTGLAEYVFDTETLRLTKIALGEPPAEDWYWSPDGAYLAYLYSDEGWFYVQAIGADGVAAQRLEFTRAPGNLVPVREGEGPLLEWRNGTTFGLRVGTCLNAECAEPGDIHYADYGIKDGRIDPVGTEMSAPGLSQAPGSSSPPATTIPDRITLKDDSVVTGTILEGQKSPFASTVGTLQIDLAEVRSFADGAVRLADGSVFKGRFGEGELTIATTRGDLTIPTQEVLSIMRGGGAPPTSPVLAPPLGQGVLTGRVLDNFKQPVDNATIRILGSSLEARTDSDGRYRLNYVPGQLAIAIQAPGYDPVQFALALAGPTEYPVEDKVLLRLPPGPGVFYWDARGWTGLQECNLKNILDIDQNGSIWCTGGPRRVYRVTGVPSRIAGSSTPILLDNRASRKDGLGIYRVDKKGEVITDKLVCGLSGMSELGRGSSTEGTSQVNHKNLELFPGRNFLSRIFDPGIYAVIDGSRSTCYTFQVGPDRPGAEQAVQDRPVSATGESPTEQTPPEVPGKMKGTNAKEEKPNSPKVEKGGPARKQESASKPAKGPPRDTRGSGSRGYTEKQQRALKDFNDM